MNHLTFDAIALTVMLISSYGFHDTEVNDLQIGSGLSIVGPFRYSIYFNSNIFVVLMVITYKQPGST